MILRNNRFTNNESQAGVTLMLAVLVLAAITAVAFSLATIVFIEIRSAADSSRTEPALYATLGVTEEALYQYKRIYDPKTPSPLNVTSCAPTNQNVCSLNGVTLSLPGTQPIAFDNSPRVEHLGARVTKTIPLYVVNNYSTQQYSYLKIQVLPNYSNGNVSISSNIYRADQIDPITGFSGTASPSSPFEISSFSSGQYELILYNPSSFQDVSVSITTIRNGVSSSEPQGLPYVGEQVLRILSNYAGLARTYQVRIPIP